MSLSTNDNNGRHLWITTLKESIGVGRDLLLMALFALLFLWPNTMNELLMNAGLSQIDAFGITWEARAKEIVKLSEQVEAKAKDQLNEVEDQLRVVQKKIRKLPADFTPTEAKRLQAAITDYQEGTENTRKEIGTLVQKQKSILNQPLQKVTYRWR